VPLAVKLPPTPPQASLPGLMVFLPTLVLGGWPLAPTNSALALAGTIAGINSIRVVAKTNKCFFKFLIILAFLIIFVLAYA
jgi:hypothetical protein